MSTPTLSFRPLQRQDLPLLAGWLAEPLVARWWCHDSSPETVERDFGPSIDGQDATEMLLAVHDGQPFGLIQRYPVGAYADDVEELAGVCEVPPGALSVDYLVGEPGARGRGLGAAMIAACVAEGWQRYPAAQDVLVPVSAGNEGSWRALERAGFTRIAEGELEPDNPVDPRDHYVYRVQRPAPGPGAHEHPAGPVTAARHLLRAEDVGEQPGGPMSPAAPGRPPVTAADVREDPPC